MHTALVQRYLGNKTPIVAEIERLVRQLAAPGEKIFDAFSGSLAVSSALRSAGYTVSCNDINHFSWTYARAYFSGSELPAPPGSVAVSATERRAEWGHWIESLTSEYGPDVPSDFRRTDIFDHYCEAGSKSGFLSQRGTSGRRRFFSAENATLIDRALSRITYWNRIGKIDERARCILIATLISAVEKVSNTQGTYHDFPRGFIDGRALKPLKLKLADIDVFLGAAADFIGKAQDSLDIASEVPEHSVLYLDPPYNFRQYTSYYFMLNLISSYPDIDDLDEYFDKIEFVRGQNMGTDFNSTFCKKSTFISALGDLIAQSKCKFVILSYFDGRNHWGEFKSEIGETAGREIIEDFLRGPLFIPGSFQCIPVARQNYQSYGGHTAKQVKEFLFVAHKARSTEEVENLGDAEWTGRELA